MQINVLWVLFLKILLSPHPKSFVQVCFECFPRQPILEHKFSVCEPDVGPRTYKISPISQQVCDLAGVGESGQSHTMPELRKEGLGFAHELSFSGTVPLCVVLPLALHLNISTRSLLN